MDPQASVMMSFRYTGFRVFDWKFFLCVHLHVHSGGMGVMWRRSVCAGALGYEWG